MKLKAKIIFEMEYDVVFEGYPPNSTIEDIMELDKIAILDDPHLYLNDPHLYSEGDCKVEITRAD